MVSVYVSGDGDPVLERPRFIGREQETRALANAWTSGPTIVLVEGEAGVGKSRLVNEFLKSHADELGRVMAWACPPYREPFSLGPLVDALRREVVDVGDLSLSPLAGALRPLFPEWESQLPPELEQLNDATAARHRLFRALNEVVSALEPDVILVEDVHWADEQTLEFLVYLLSTHPSRPALIVTYRPADVRADSLLTRLSTWTGDSRARLRLQLGGLDSAGTAALVSSMLGDEPVTEAFATFLHERTEGLPLAIEELIRLLHARSELVHRHEGWLRRSLDEIDVPPSIRDVVVERLTQVESDVRGVLDAAAVLGDPTDEATIGLVSGLQSAVVSDALADAMTLGWLEDDGGGRSGYRHALFRRAVYDAIPTPRRRVLHHRAGRALETLRPPPLEQLTRHFRVAGEVERWAEYAERAADQAVASNDPLTATALLNDLIRATDLPMSLSGRLARKLAEVTLLRREAVDELHVHVVETLRRSLDSARLDTPTAAAVRELRARLLLQMGEYETAHHELELALPDLDHEPYEAAVAMTYLAFPMANVKPAAEYLNWLQRAALVAEKVHGTSERISLQTNRATALLLLGEESGWEVTTTIPDHSDDPEQARRIARMHSNIAYVALLWGRYDEAAKHLTAALRMAASLEMRRLHSTTLATKARFDWVAGRWGELADVPTRAAELEPQETPDVEWHLVDGLLEAATGQPEVAEAKLRSWIGGSTISTFPDLTMSAAAGLARLRLSSGDVDGALDATADSIETLRRSTIWLLATDVLPVRVEALIRSGRLVECENLVTEFEHGLADLDAPAPQAARLTCRALLSAATDAADAATKLESAAAAWDALSRPYEASLVREQLAIRLTGQRRTEDAVTALTAAFDRLAELGARRDADRVAASLHQLGVEVRRPWRAWRGGRRGYGDRLSPSELAVVRLVAAGQTNRAIADALSKSPKTVAMQVNSAMRKLGASNRTELAVRAVAIGVVDGEPAGG